MITVSYNPQSVIQGLVVGHGDDVESATAIAEDARKALQEYCERNGHAFEEGGHHDTVLVDDSEGDSRETERLTDVFYAIVQRCIENG